MSLFNKHTIARHGHKCVFKNSLIGKPDFYSWCVKKKKTNSNNNNNS